MLSGEGYIDWHISYKNKNGKGVVAGAYQWSPESPLKYRVFGYVGANRPDTAHDLKEYLGESDEVLESYCHLLSALTEPRERNAEYES